jgi:cell division GTPase FtsZ
MMQQPIIPTPFKFEGEMSKQQIRNYLRELRMYLATQVVAPDEKARIENEIDRFTNIDSIAQKISFRIVEK